MTIRLDPAAGPISGLLVTDEGEREFSGWIQLAGLIESQRSSLAASVESGAAPVSPPAGSPGSPEAPRAS